jgi:hypothetical protein
VLHIIRREVPLHNRNVTLDERTLEHSQHDLFIAFHVDLNDLQNLGSDELQRRRHDSTTTYAVFVVDCSNMSLN